MLGVDEQDARADRLGGFEAAEQHVLKQRAAESGTLVCEVDSEASEQNRR